MVLKKFDKWYDPFKELWRLVLWLGTFLTRFHRWYDTLQEPWRLLLCLGIVLPLFMSLNAENVYVILLGLICLVIVAFSRIIWIEGKRKEKE